jgi:hypothetical protein
MLHRTSSPNALNFASVSDLRLVRYVVLVGATHRGKFLLITSAG